MVQQCSDLNSDMVKSPLVDLCPPLLKSSCHAHLDICSPVCAYEMLHSVCSCDHCAMLILFARAGAGPQCDNYTSASPHTKYSILNTEYLHLVQNILLGIYYFFFLPIQMYKTV